MFVAARAQAAERIFWDNYDASPPTIASANLDGGGGSLLNLTGVELREPEGMTYDSATGRLYVASPGSGANGQILWVNIDGTGAGVLSTPGAPVESPHGIAVDPDNGTVYWVNTEGNGAVEGSIAYAKVDGSGGGMLNTGGAELSGPYRLAVDPSSGRVFWTNYGPQSEPGYTPVISYANLDNSGGGGNLTISGVTYGVANDGLAVDSTTGRIYWLGEKAVSYAGINGGSGTELPLAGATYDEPYGLAIDPSVGKAYWGNYNIKTSEPNGIGFESVTGSAGGAITPTGVEADGLQDPVIVKSPTGTEAPAVSRVSPSRVNLSCSRGGWAPDYAGSFVYQAPQSYAYQWTDNGAPIAGATGTTLTASSKGSYACVVTGSNPLGSASQTSAAVTVKAAKLKLTTKKKANVKAGKAATFKVKVVNQGDLATSKAKICVKVPKKAKKTVKAPKCRSIGKLAGGATKSVTLKLKIAKKATPGTYKVSILAKGVPANTVKAKVVVKAKKKAGKKK